MPLGRETLSGAQIYKLVYRSQISGPFDLSKREAEIADILSVSLAWNSSNGITGALLLSPTGYAQVLEGPPHAVKALFGHIACDPRHQNVELLYSDYDAERDFGDWAMAVVGPAGEDDVEIAATACKRNSALSSDAYDIRMMLRWLLIDEPLLNEPVERKAAGRGGLT